MKKIFKYLLSVDVDREYYNQIRQILWKRNLRACQVTSVLAMLMGGVFLIVNLARGSTVIIPYIFLLAESLLSFLLMLFVKRLKDRKTVFKTIVCYFEMLVICFYAVLLTIDPSNKDIPATSVIVFITVLPLAIDDRPIRMFGMMIFESIAYIIASYYLKTPHAFSLDLMNVITFSIIGMVLYGMVSYRNIRELYHTVRIEGIQKGVITSLATVVEERDESTGDHIQRTSLYTNIIVKLMKKNSKYSKVRTEFYKNVVLAAPMHDVGKIKIPDQILNKPGKLTPEEYEIMKKHAEYGGEIILRTLKNVEEQDYFDIAYNIACYHHERYDGTGYPKGLKGEDIPLEARIMAIADVYDALTSERCYKKPIPKDEALKILEDGSGTQFDPVLCMMFVNYMRQNDAQ